MATNVGKLTDLKAAVGTFDPETLQVTSNVDKAWKLYMQKFENACKFLGINDADKAAALMLTAGDNLATLFDTLEITGTGTDGAIVWGGQKGALNGYFSDKKNLTARRWEFLNTKMKPSEATKDYCTRLNQKASDCEWDKMTTHDAVKLTVCLHTGIEKLRDEILVNDIKYENLIAKATAFEHAVADKEFMKKSMGQQVIAEEEAERYFGG